MVTPQRSHSVPDRWSRSLPAFWRLSSDRITVSCVLVVFEIEAQRAVRLARRYGQVGVVHVQRIPFERVVLLEWASSASRCRSTTRRRSPMRSRAWWRGCGGGRLSCDRHGREPADGLGAAADLNEGAVALLDGDGEPCRAATEHLRPFEAVRRSVELRRDLGHPSH